jgi:RNA polymerase sigma factor (sigma-70 family)
MERSAGGDRPLSDRDLMVRLAAGDREALHPLMERHYRRLYRITLAYLRNPDDALDAVQETFVKAFQNAVRWDAASEVGPWLSRIAINHAIDRYRREKRRRQTLTPFDDDARELPYSSDDPSPERMALGREVGVKIAAALRALPERQRAVFVLRHYEEHSLEEIAGVLGLSLGTVKSNLHRAIRRLRERLGGLSA